ncbi:hypothetical protein AN958_11870 [Leucoagaricus sp. SymC.cos]|nr:hypothetical protein AN958_11870 [Leucoagaricus sp. SymC.cos]
MPSHNPPSAVQTEPSIMVSSSSDIDAPMTEAGSSASALTGAGASSTDMVPEGANAYSEDTGRVNTLPTPTESMDFDQADPQDEGKVPYLDSPSSPLSPCLIKTVYYGLNGGLTLTEVIINDIPSPSLYYVMQPHVIPVVEDDEDSEEEGGGWDNLVGENKAFVVDDRDLIEDTGGHTRRNLEIEVLKRGNSLRHVIEKWSGVNIKKPKPFKYHEFSLPPNTNHDWELWEVPMNGYILVEAWEWNDVVGICNGTPGVRWWEICHIPFIDRVALLNQQLPPFSVAPGDWIHLKVAPYMNDLAFVLQTGLPRPKPAKLQCSCLEPSLEVKLQELDKKYTDNNLEVVVVPHLDYKPPSPQFKQARGPHSIPQPCLFDLKQAFAASSPLSVTEIPDPLHSTPNPPPSALALPTPIGAAPGLLFSSTLSSPPIKYCYHDLTFDVSGFFLLSISPSQCHHVCIHLTIEQLQPFLPSLSIPPTSKLHTFHLASARELKEGDKVKVVGLTYADSIGIIKELTPTYAYLLLDSLASAQIPYLFLCWYYKIGDQVTIKAGVDAGLIGYIIAVNDKNDTVVICNPLVTIIQVITLIYYVEFAADGLHFRKLPPHSLFIIAKLVDMRDPTFAHLENLHIVVTKGPLKGQ